MRKNNMMQKVIALLLTIAALMAGQTAQAEKVTYTISGSTEQNGYVNFEVTASGDASGTVSDQWNYNSTSEFEITLPGDILLSFGTNKDGQGLAVQGLLQIEATNSAGGFIKLSHDSKYIYHVTLKDNGSTPIHEAWNMTKSYTHSFQQITVKTIIVEYADKIPITDAVISGLSSSYLVSNAAVTPVPTVTWHGTTLTNNTHYTLSYQNNTAAGTATVTATGTGKFSSSTNVSANYTLVWATYNVRFNKNNDSAKGTMTDQAFFYTEQKALSANAFTRTGYHFDRWTTEADGTGDSYTDEQSVSNLTAENGTTIDLYAQWTAPYIDADGNEQTCSNYNIITGSTDNTVTLGTNGTESWYVVDDNVSITNNGSEVLNFHGAVHLILMDGATLTVAGRLPISAYGSLTIYGQSHGTGCLVANGSSSAISVSDYNNLIANVGTLTINGGNITATSSNSNGINVENAITINGGSVTASSSSMYGKGITSTNGGITINGGTVNATGGSFVEGINAYGTLTFGWRNTTDRITASSYYGRAGVVVKSGQAFTDGTNIYAGTLTTEQTSTLAGKTLMGVDVLLDDDSLQPAEGKNAARIAALAADGKQHNIILMGRTLYKDGNWNTLCLPFNATLTDDLADATLMELDTEGTYEGNKKTGLDGTTLNLYFKTATSISAGKPYIIKWASGNNITNPTFTGVTISGSASTEVSFTGGKFIGTYSPIVWKTEDKSILFLGVGKNGQDEDVSTLYYPDGTATTTIGACRAYFKLTASPDPSQGGVKEFKLNFGDENEVDGVNEVNASLEVNDDSWYDMQGRRLGGKPKASGIYINNGNKIVIK